MENILNREENKEGVRMYQGHSSNSKLRKHLVEVKAGDGGLRERDITMKNKMKLMKVKFRIGI